MKIWNAKFLEHCLKPEEYICLQKQVERRVVQFAPIETGIHSKLCSLEQIKCFLFDVYGTLLLSASHREVSVSGVSSQELPPVCGPRLQSRLHKPILNSERIVRSEQDIESEALSCLPVMIQDALSSDFSPTQQIASAITAQHHLMRRQYPYIQYPEVDILSLWHAIFIENLKEDIVSRLNPYILASFALEYELLTHQVHLMPGAVELLQYLNQRGLLIGIISNAQFYTPIILSTLFKVQDLDRLKIKKELCFWSYLYGYGKPQRELFQSAKCELSKKQILEHQVLYVGNDMLNDVWGALQVGFLSALFVGDKRSLRLRPESERVVDLDPDVIITDLSQLQYI